jgi:signal transduction histidine kinase
MKLINRYNQYLFPALFMLFIISTISSFFLTKKVLQDELDEVLIHSKKRIENYVLANHALPVVNSFDDEQIFFEKINTPLKDSGLSATLVLNPITHKKKNFRQLVFGTMVGDQLYKVSVSAPLEGVKDLTKMIVKITVVTIFFLLLFIMIINKQVLSKIWQPFYQSLDMIKSFKVNKKDALNFPSSSIEEFELMNKHFSLAAENASRDFNTLKEFSENASHEIQTPLAIIHSKIDLLAQQENLTEKQSELLQSLYASVNKLSKIQRSLLLLTKIDNNQFSKKSEIALNEEIVTKIEQFHDIWQNKEINYTPQIKKTTISCNKELLEILLNNLFSNATRHNITNGSIKIKLEEGQLEISNTGLNEPLDTNRIFKRFYKVQPNNDSNGLGLSIINEICNAFSFEIMYAFKDYQHTFKLKW